MIQIFCGLQLGEVAKIKLKDLNGLIKHFTEVFSEKPQLIRNFKIKNIEFGFISNLENIRLRRICRFRTPLKRLEYISQSNGSNV